MAKSDDFLLTAEELRLRGLKRRRIFIAAALLFLLLLVAIFGGRPLSLQIKAWQARRHAQKAFAFIEQQKWAEAQSEAVAAYQLRRTEPQALRAIARFLSRTGQGEALDFWSTLEKQAPLTREDHRDRARSALASGEPSTASAAVHDLLTNERLGRPGPSDWLLAARLEAQKGAPEAAASFLKKTLADPSATEPEQFEAALLQIALPDDAGAEVSEAWARLVKLSQGQSTLALQSLMVLARHALSSPRGQRPPALPPTPELARALEAHPLSRASQKLLALDLQIQMDAKQTGALIGRAIETWKNADPTSLVTLANWLNARSQHQRRLDVIPLEKSLQTKELFISCLDAMAALGRWTESKELLQQNRPSLDPMIQQMYLARCSAQLGEKAAAENSWQRALEAAGGKVEKLMVFADYAQKNDLLDVADAAYRRAISEAPKYRAAREGRLRLAQRERDTKKMHEILVEMLHLWPKDPSLQNDEAYTRLLLLPAGPATAEELAAVEKLADQLVTQKPASLPHRSLLALARLKQNRPAEALNVYANLKVSPGVLLPSTSAVHAAVLSAAGRGPDARTEANGIALDQLLPEERALLDKVRD